MSRIEIAALSRMYTQHVGLRSFDLAIEDGEFITLLGASGCGKTTTLRCVAGLESPDSGLIRFGDDVIVDSAQGRLVPVHKRDIGMVFQSYALWPHMSVEANVAYPLKVAGVAKADRLNQAADALAVVGLEGYGSRSISALSGGQQQRVALARALARKPQLLLLDEPLSNLDAGLRVQMRKEIKRIHRETGTTTLYVTHDQLEAATLSDRVVVMDDGKIVETGSPVDIFNRPKTRTVAEFVGFQNLIEGVVTSAHDRQMVSVQPAGWSSDVVAMASEKLSPGDEACLCFRAGVVEIVSGGGIAAIVEDLLYLGDGWEAHLVVGDSQVVAAFSTLPDGLANGDRIEIRLAAESALAIAAAEGSS